jgi:hypothetical protein
MLDPRKQQALLCLDGGGVTNLVTISGNSSPALSGLIKSDEQKFCPQNETKI